MTRLIALTGVTIISFSAIFVRLAEVAPTTAGFFRAAYAIPLLWVLRRLTGDDRSPSVRRLALISGVFLATDITLWHTSIDLIGAGLATIVVNTQVLWVGVLAWLIHRERPTATAFVVVPIVLLGVALVGGVGSSVAYGSNPGLGAVLALGAGLFYASFLLVFRHASAGQGPTAGPLLDVSIGISVAIGLGGWLDPGFSLVPEWPAHGWLLALSLGVHAGGWLLIAIALPRLPALETSVMLLLQPALTLVWAMILFTERLSGAQWLGTALVLVGITLGASRGLVRPADEGAPRGP